MRDYNPPAKKRTDPRPDYIHLGVDTEGGSHVYHTPTESVYTIEDTNVAYHESLEGRSINVYMDYIAERRGWTTRDMFHTMADAIVTQAEEAI
ncbi:hypothetical protein [Natronococcus wangiae]|uniref:hypothetical protein n=1 Tax=Natronococcus wangiae TaxID=3068275 RepID=UPI00273E22D6|nr:hypothetical protein [Natronococcus sp. AD5]